MISYQKNTFPIEFPSTWNPTGNVFIILYDARVKSLKPRCACTGVVLWLNDPPRYEHKSGASASRYANIG